MAGVASSNSFAALQRAKKQAPKVQEDATESFENGIDRHEEIEKAIFSSSAGFGDWAEDVGTDWAATAPEEEEEEDGWNQAKQGARLPSAIRSAFQEPADESQDVFVDDTIHDVLAEIDVEAELGIELGRSDEEEEEEMAESQEPEVVPDKKDEKPVKEQKSNNNLSKKEMQELKKKELEDLDAMLAELGVDTKPVDTEDSINKQADGNSSKAAKRRAKKERKMANDSATDQDDAESERDHQAVNGDVGPAIDAEAVKARKAALKKKVNQKKTSAAAAAAAAVAGAKAKAKKTGPKDKSKFNEFPTR